MKITVFTKNDCDACQQLKKWLNKNDIIFDAKNIEHNLNNKRAFVDAHKNLDKEIERTFPTTVIEKSSGTYLVQGNRPDLLTRLIK